MIICPNCNKQLDDGTAFCDNCGTQIVAPQAPVVEQAPVVDPTAVQQPYAPVYEAAPAVEPQAGKKFNKKLIALGGAAVAVVLVLAIVLSSLVFGGKASYPYAFYIKDGEMFYTKTGKIKPIQATIKLDDTGDRSSASYAGSGSEIGNFLTISHDGDLLFFMDKVGNNDTPLYWRYMNDTKKEPVKIDGDVDNYEVSIDGKIVTLTNGEGNLYQYNVKKAEKEKIASDVSYFYVSDDGKHIYFVVNDGEGEKTEQVLYYKKSGKDKEKIQGEFGNINFISEDFKTIYYTQEVKGDEGTTYDLYKKKAGKDKQKIASDVSSVRVYESGEIYYLKSGDEKSYYDFVEDDAQGTYKSLEETKVDFGSICYYDGKKEVVLSTTSQSFEARAQDAVVAIYTNVDVNQIGKVNPANLEDGSSIYDAIEKKINEAAQYVLAVEDKTSVIDLADIDDVEAISKDGSVVYLAANFKEGKDGKSSTNDIYEMKVSGSKAKKPELYEADVNNFRLVDEDTIFTKEEKEDKADLYVNKNKVASDVYDIALVNDNNLDELVYLTDKSADKGTYTLNFYNGKKSVKIADDASDYFINPEGDVLYITEYKNNKGDLYVFNGKKSEKIDTDVNCIVRFYDKYAEED